MKIFSKPPAGFFVLLGSSRAILIALALMTTAMAYLPGHEAPFFFDSSVWLLGNDAIAKISPAFASLYQAAFSGQSGPLGRTVSMSSFSLEALLFGGLSPPVANSVNIGIHLLNGLLLYRLLELFVPKGTSTPPNPVASLPPWAPAAVAALWLLLPIHVSTVLYTIQRMTLLATTGVFAGLWAYLSARMLWARSQPTARSVMATGTAVLVWTVVAGMAKENGLLLPFLLLGVELCLMRGVVRGAEMPVIRTACATLLLLPVVSVALALILAPGMWADWYAGRSFDVTERLLTQTRILWQYLSWIVLPDLRELAFYHDDIPLSRSLFEPWSTAVAVACWAAVIGVAWAVRRRAPWVTFGVVWFLIAHSLESTVVPLEIVFEHRNYLAAVGPLLVVVTLIGTAMERIRAGLSTPVFIGVAVLYAFLLALRSQYWGDELTLATHHLKFHPHSERATFHYANVNLRLGEAEKNPEKRLQLILVARRYYERILELNPGSVVGLAGLVYIDAAWFPALPGRTERLRRIEVSLGAGPLDASGQNSLGMLVGCVVEGVCKADGPVISDVIDRARSTRCCSASVLEYQSARLHALPEGNPERALQHAMRSIELDPTSRPAYLLAIELELRRGERGEAVQLLGGWMRNDPSGKHLAEIASVLQ